MLSIHPVQLALAATAEVSVQEVFSGDWTWPPLVIIPLILAMGLYSVGTAKMLASSARPSVRKSAVICFALGWVSLLLALDSPVHELGEQLFWVHMTQHEILMLISAPLLVGSRPLVPFLYALSPSRRKQVADLGHTRLIQSFWRAISAPIFAWLFSALALWIWHAPWLFERTLHSEWIHAAQHTSFFVSALIFWWPLANMKPSMGYGGGMLYVFTTALHTSLLGVLLTFTSRPWYASYAATAPLWHLSALEDQQLGGLIMWIPAGTLLFIVFLFLLVRWINESQARWQFTRMADLTHSSQGATE